jgi:hypothetical protein
MKSTFLTVLIATILAFGSFSAMAQTGTTTFTTATSGSFTGDVINSTYTFSGEGVSGFNAVFEQTQIPQATLNSIAPPANFQLELTNFDYVDTQNLFHGSGTPLEINVAFTVTPTINQGASTTATLTLISTQSFTGDVQASSQSPVDFVLASPVEFPLSLASDLGNLASIQSGQSLSTWNDSVSNLEEQGQATSTVGGQTFSYNLNGTFSDIGGTLEVIYSAPEPNSGWLALIATVGMGGLFLARRKARA